MARSLAAFVLLLACGARTGLTLDRPDATVDGPRPCLHDFECDDAVGCTRDRCEGGTCVRDPLDERCDDGLFCSGDERCDPVLDCVSAPRSCEEGVTCTEDVCVEETDECTHEPDADLCPISHRCDPVRGCVARTLVNTPEALYDVDLPSGETHFIGRTDFALTDIALRPDGRLFGVNFFSFFEVRPETAELIWLWDLEGMNALDFGPDGLLYAAGTAEIVRMDVDAASIESYATFPPGFASSGDIAFVEGRMLVTASNAAGGGDWLVEVPAGGGVAREIGPVGRSCIYALAPFGATLYGLTCDGVLLRIDTTTGAGTVLSETLGLTAYGAAAR